MNDDSTHFDRRQFSLADLFLGTAICAVAITAIRQGLMPVVIVAILTWPLGLAIALLRHHNARRILRIQIHALVISIIVIGYVAAYESSAAGYMIYYLGGWQLLLAALYRRRSRRIENASFNADASSS